MKDRRFLLIASYIVTIIFCVFVFIFFINILGSMNGYYVALFLPILVLFTILTVSYFIKMILLVVSLVFGNNGNNEINDKVDLLTNKINCFLKNSLLVIFILLLIITMILDIILCIQKGKMILLVLSIIIWLCLIYSIMQIILNRK